jgi:hypothetical protein
MPHYSEYPTISPSTSKLDYIEALKEAVGPEGLRTLHPDEAKPPWFEDLQQSLASSTATAPARYTCSTDKPLPVTLRNVSNSPALHVGFGESLPRWASDPPQPVNFAAFANWYPRPGLALVAANALWRCR